MKTCYPCVLPFFISQKWNENPQYYNKIGLKAHNGIDFALPTGTPVYATHDGVVWFAGTDQTMSETVMVSSVYGAEKGYRTVYAHLSEIKVNSGDKVKKGQLIALSGNTGRYTSGPHLHYGVHEIENYSDTNPDNGYNGCIDPAQFFDGTYPNTKEEVIPEHFTRFQEALKNFQTLEGLTPYPLMGVKTKKALNKYLKSIKYE